jgi:hypothetical protein
MSSADRSGTRWLLAELPELVTAGVITQESADALRQHYSAEVSEPPRRFGFVLSAILGSLLVGAGIVLLVAHNWDFLSRPIRCTIAFAPLVLSLALAFFVLLRRDGSAPWREAAAILNVAAIGTAIALVSQTYQIQGDFARFILVWMLLALPIVYIFGTGLGLSAYFVGATVWVMSAKNANFLFGRNPGDLWVWILLLLGVPAFLLLWKRNRNGYATLLALTSLAVAAAFSLGRTDDIGAQSFWRCSFAAYWVLVYLVGLIAFKDWRPRRPHPFVAIGWIGILSLAVFVSFRQAWRTHQWQTAVDLTPRHYPDLLAGAIQGGWVLAAILFGAYAFWKWRDVNLAPAAFTPVVVLIWCFAKAGDSLTPSLVMNAFLLALGIFTLVRGIRAGNAYEANLGMIVIAILAVARFFDSDFEFVVRGIAFIAIGLGFLVTNLVVFKRRARA